MMLPDLFALTSEASAGGSPESQPGVLRLNEIDQDLADAARDVLGTMFFTDLVGDGEPCNCEPDSLLGVCVPFSGDAEGVFSFAIQERVAEALTVNFLGMVDTSPPSRQDIEEVMRELGNMLCGAFLSRSGADCLFALDSPQIERPAPPPPFTRSWTLDESHSCLKVKVRWDRLGVPPNETSDSSQEQQPS
jgi:hypothetical protein